MRKPEHRCVNISQLYVGAGSRSARLYFTLLLNAMLLSIAAQAAPANGSDSAGAQAKATISGDSEEAHTCVSCHSDVVKGFANNPHAKPAAIPRGTDETCASCHGPGRAHLQSGCAKSDIFDPAEATAKQVADMCMGCHAGAHAASERPSHGNVSCIGCHSIHAARAPVHMLKVPETQLCYQCHADIKPEFSMPFRHKVEEGLIMCTDCHDPHNTSMERLPRPSTRQNTACTTCHTETAGPFVYDHAAVKAEGCTACHVAHGGSNPHLLNRAKVDTICQQCHLPSLTSIAGLSLESAHNSTTQSKSCTDCHTDIHGSNVSPEFLRKE